MYILKLGNDETMMMRHKLYLVAALQSEAESFDWNSHEAHEEGGDASSDDEYSDEDDDEDGDDEKYYKKYDGVEDDKYQWLASKICNISIRKDVAIRGSGSA
jgi:hypothetical protein